MLSICVHGSIACHCLVESCNAPQTELGKWGKANNAVLYPLMRTCCPLLLSNMDEIAASMMQPLSLTSLQWLPDFTITNPTHSYHLFNTEGH